MKIFKITEQQPIGPMIPSELHAIGKYDGKHDMRIEKSQHWTDMKITYAFGQKIRDFIVQLDPQTTKELGQVLLKMAAYKARRAKADDT